MVVELDGPFAGVELEEVPLPASPLTRVIAQFRFPVSLSIGGRDQMRGILGPLEADYPVIREGRQASLVVLGDRIVPGEEGAAIWRMTDLASEWTVSISDTFAALETTKYRNRADLLGRLTSLAAALAPANTAARLDRFGLRHINQVPAGTHDLRAIFRADIQGPLAVPLGQATELQLGLCQAQFSQGEIGLRAHWGIAPAGMTPDPSVAALPDPSGLLDIDVFTVHPSEYSVTQVVTDAERCSRLAYAFFRWSIRDELLREWETQP